MTPTYTLTQDQVEFFHREGYLAIDAMTNAEEVAQIRQWLSLIHI